MKLQKALPRFTTTVIQIEARPTTGYRAVFDEIDDDTGRPVVSSWYGSHDEVVRTWAPHGFVSIQQKDGRVIELESLLHACQKAYEHNGSLGVTSTLSEHEFKRTQVAANNAAADLDAHVDEWSSSPIKYNYDRALPCRAFKYSDYTVTGLRIDVLFEHEFRPAAEGSSTVEADEMNQLLRVSYSHDTGIELHQSEGCPEVSIVDYLLAVQTAPGVSRYFSIEQSEFNEILGSHRKRFRECEALSTGSWSYSPKIGVETSLQ